MWTLCGVERLECPDDIRSRLTEIGGLNPYDEPRFRLSWAQTETFRASTFWNESDSRRPRDLLVGDGTPHWMLQEWHPASDYGGRAAWEARNAQAQVWLEYPAGGKYETVLDLASHRMIAGRLVVEPIPLSWVVLEVMVPIIMEARKISALRRRMAFLEQREKEKSERIERIEDALRGASPAFSGAARSAQYLKCNSLVHKRAEALERYWQRIAKVIARTPKGLSQMSGRPLIR